MKTQAEVHAAINELVERFYGEPTPDIGDFKKELWYSCGLAVEEDSRSTFEQLYGEFLSKLTLPKLSSANFNRDLTNDEDDTND